MKRWIMSAVVVLGLAGAMVVGADKPAAKEKSGSAATTKPTTKPAVAVNKFCPIERENPVDATVPTVTYKGKVIGFCCDDCPATFKKNPEKYMKDLK